MDFPNFQNNRPVISVITPTLNQGRFIAETIESVISQAGDFHIDYIIVDAGSSDETVEVVKKYEALIASGAWPVKCLGINYRWLSEKDGGQSDGINKGFLLAKGEIFAWLNSDDLYCPGTLQKVAAIDWNRFGFCYGDGLWIDKSGLDLDLYPTFPPNIHSLSFECTLCQPTVFFSRRTYKNLGALSLDYDLVFDYEYWLRAVFKHTRFIRVKGVLAQSRMYPENKSLYYPIKGATEKRKLLDQYYGGKKLNILLSYYWRIVVVKKTRQKSESLITHLKGIS